MELFVQPQLLAEAECTRVLAFDLGLLGRCRIFVEGPDDSTDAG